MYGTSHYEKEPRRRHPSSRGFYSSHRSFIPTAGAKLGEDITPLKSKTVACGECHNLLFAMAMYGMVAACG